jgi:hypothetical protein
LTVLDALLANVDCERLSDGLLAQPVAAVSSLSFVVAGVWLASRRPSRSTEPMVATTYAALVALVGVGSVAYHGPQGPGAKLLHDGSIVLVIAVGALVPLVRRMRGAPALCQGGGLAFRIACAAAAAGVVAYVLGRTGAPLCDPRSPLQPHALWHVLVAVALAAWGAALWASAPAVQSPAASRRSRR